MLLIMYYYVFFNYGDNNIYFETLNTWSEYNLFVLYFVI